MYGIRTADSAFASDIPFLRSHNFDDRFTVRLIKVCGSNKGSYMSLEGV